MKKIFGLLIIILFSCDNEIPIEDNFVVEAFLFQGEKVDDVRIKETKLWNSEDSIDTYIGNANIKIYGNGSEYSLEYNSTEGNYFIDDDLEIISGNTYGLEVNVDDRTATAETVVPTKPIGLILLLVAVFPANIYLAQSTQAQEAIGATQDIASWRLPVQGIFIWIAYWIRK